MWRRGWDSNPTRRFRFCKLQILKSHNSHTCQRCRGALHAVARSSLQVHAKSDCLSAVLDQHPPAGPFSGRTDICGSHPVVYRSVVGHGPTLRQTVTARVTRKPTARVHAISASVVWLRGCGRPYRDRDQKRRILTCSGHAGASALQRRSDVISLSTGSDQAHCRPRMLLSEAA
jgi:hypothetical protein